MTSYRFSKMAATQSEIYFRVQWRHLIKKTVIYVHTTFRWDISIHGRDKSTSGFANRTAAILKFNFQFLWFWPICTHRHVILSASTCQILSWTIGGGVMTSYRFFKIAAIYSRKSTCGFKFRDGTRLRRRRRWWWLLLLLILERKD